MSNIRIHNLAKELGIKSKTLVEELKRQGIEVKTHMSSIDEETAELVRSILFEKEGEKISKKESPVSKEETEAVSKEEPPKKKIRLSEAITVKELAEVMGCGTNEVIKKLMEMGTISTINQIIDMDVATIIAKKFGFEAEVISIESDEIITEEEDSGEAIPRPPIVTIMGHVNHGKTSLLDAIRKSNITDTEAGGITQHIGAYEVEVEKGKIVFLDTPGHEAFTAMRARGAQITDTVVLVIAADDGIMPQTVEAINHATAANVPIIVAINKIDKPNANPNKIKKDLTEYNLVPEEWGGSTIFVEVSAKKRIGLENLMEMILLQAEMMELKANPNMTAKGIIIEAKLDRGRGPIATVLVQRGTLKVGDSFVSGLHYGKIRALINDKGRKTEKAIPSTPVEVLGFSDVPHAGDSFVVVKDERKARQIGDIRLQRQREESLLKTSRVTLEDLHHKIEQGEIRELRLVIKGDVQGSVQVLGESLAKLSTPEVSLKVIHGGVGGITETDILLASASNAIVIGFNVRPTDKAGGLAKKEKIEMKLYTVIYDVISDIKSAIEGLLEPTFVEKVMGRAEVRKVFTISKVGHIAGCYVTDGIILRNSEARLIRDSTVVHQGKIISLKRFKEDAKEVPSGFECGIRMERFHDIKIGDVIEPFIYEEVIKKLGVSSN
ncbi:MAG: translation initiation factor IF-2 [Nitrospinae bacterium]|nr:translation initiation factor IF-2 [Nitrospinota bacterium]